MLQSQWYPAIPHNCVLEYCNSEGIADTSILYLPIFFVIR